ncbi:MAG: thiamine pyrophosphate-dependent dehydrogenase E1 component subunit alpha [Actinomycetota bacterium]|nr:thiamine pyrophosphate-dependent dehydrogenase E1 component subunit alpha [Actinomycetota bacterium]
MTDEEQLEGLLAMLRIRMFEDRVRTEFAKGGMPGFVHTYSGAEAIAVGVIGALEPADLITSTHRGHGHCLAKGAPLDGIVAELYGRETGLCKGRGGSMHIADFANGMLGANAIVGGGIALAVGGALASQVLGDGRVAVAFFGDGASNEGVFHESLNLASIWSLPVVFVCENNGWAESTPFSYASSVSSIAERGVAYSIPAVSVDGTDLTAVRAAASAAVARARQGNGPSLLECIAPRREGHFVGDPEEYRGREQADQARESDPIDRLAEQLVARGILSAEALNAMRKDWSGQLDRAYEFALAGPWPDPLDVERYVYS